MIMSDVRGVNQAKMGVNAHQHQSKSELPAKWDPQARTCFLTSCKSEVCKLCREVNPGESPVYPQRQRAAI